MAESKGAYTILHQLNSGGIEVGRIIAEKSVYDNDLDTWTFMNGTEVRFDETTGCLLYTSPSPRDGLLSRMPSSA